MTGIVIAAVALFLCVAPLAAQYRISGDVVEAGTGRPLGDAEVRLDPRDGGVDMVTKTNAGGMFEFALEHPGAYPLTVSKKGYLAEMPGGSDSIAPATVTVDAAHPARTVRFTLMQPGGISGTVLDEVTREPIPHLTVTVMSQRLVGWNRFEMPATSMASDEQGHFTLKGLNPGKYFVLTMPRKAQIVKQFSQEERGLIDEDYDQTAFPGGVHYTPGGPHYNPADMVDVTSGAAVDLGKLIVKKVLYYRAAVSLPPSVCDARETAQVDLLVPSLRSRIDLNGVPCGKDFLITGLRPANYAVQAWFEKTGSLARAYAPVTVRADDGNPHVTLAPVRASEFDGKISTEHDAAPLNLAKITVRLLPLPSSHTSSSDAVPDAAGSFHIAGFHGMDAVMQVSGLTPPFYVKSIRFDGVPLDDRVLSLDPNGTSHSLDILLDDKPAALSGNVTKNGQRVEAPYVVLLPWPRPGQPRPISGDAAGQFQFAGLLPGEYRVLAVAAKDAQSIRDPDVLERALAHAQKVDLESNRTARITLELLDLK